MLLNQIIIIISITFVTTRGLTEENDRYIIVLKDESTLQDIEEVISMIEKQEQKEREMMEMKYVNNLIPMISGRISVETVIKIAALPVVDYIEKDQPVHMLPITDKNYNASEWLINNSENVNGSTTRYNLDMINNPSNRCRNYRYKPPNDGTGVDIYIMDTGINYSHQDFKDSNGKTRAKYGGFEAVNPVNYGWDCQGHGSHCAGIAGGLASGVAKGANLYSIRVLSCAGDGTTEGVVEALDFIADLHKKKSTRSNFVASIVSMSLGGGKSIAMNRAVNRLVSTGVVVVTASGNDGADACLTSPGSAGLNINVGAHSEPILNSKVGCKNPIEAFSNWGSCVDVIAPGRDIKSVDYRNNYDFRLDSGTSMACPHVAGAAAIIMQSNRFLNPEQVKQKIVRDPEIKEDMKPLNLSERDLLPGGITRQEYDKRLDRFTTEYAKARDTLETVMQMR
ncbi:Proteinase T-like [Oopsacas minuta]|uniref:Proteinase T-like n=1 Tax=Oopsacas minuta TaxID=111878 RepID=A0AAV7JJ58_9METZ|nr:Proteinase T-like [Oopsacas minuta]